MINLFESTPTGKEYDNLRLVLESRWWANGKRVKYFEEKFAKYVGAKYAVATNSCTAALHLAVLCADLPDEVTVSPLTFVSSALAPLYAGKKVKFVDIQEDSLCTISANIQVLYAGNESGQGLIYDMAHAGGMKHKGFISCWSFHAVKNLPTGDGGMLTTNDDEVYKKAKRLSWCGIDKSTFERSQKKYAWEYEINEVGFKYHMNDLTAAIGLAQLEELDKNNSIRRDVASWYDTFLDEKIIRPFPSSTWHLYTIRVDNRDKLIDRLASHGITAGVHYKPLYKYPIFKSQPLPVTEKVYKRILSLPMHTGLTKTDVKKVCSIINSFVNE